MLIGEMYAAASRQGKEMSAFIARHPTRIATFLGLSAEIACVVLTLWNLMSRIEGSAAMSVAPRDAQLYVDAADSDSCRH